MGFEPLESRQLLSITALQFTLPTAVANAGVSVGIYSNTSQLWYDYTQPDSWASTLDISSATSLLDPLTPVPPAGHTGTYTTPQTFSITLPDSDVDITAGELFIFVGKVTTGLAVTSGTVAAATATTDPATGTAGDNFAQFEFTYVAGSAAAGGGLDIDSSAVDSTGLPFTISYPSDADVSYPLDVVGITLSEADLNAKVSAAFKSDGAYSDYPEFRQCATYDQQADPTSTTVVAPQDILAAEVALPSIGSATAEETTDAILAAGPTYYYGIRAVSSGGESLMSNYANVTLSGTENSVSLTWTPYYDPNTIGYNVYRYTATDGSTPDNSTLYSLIATVYGATTTSYTDLGAIVQAKQSSVNTASNYGFNSLSEYYTSEIQNFFEYYETHTFSIIRDGAVWAGNTVTYAPTDSWNTAGESYTVLQLVAQTDGTNITAGSVINIYMPFFSTNYISDDASETLPSMPSWLQPAIDSRASASQMVFACNGVFASNTVDPEVINNAGLNKALGDIENSIVSAFNRGIATTYDLNPNNWAAFPQIISEPTVSGTAAAGADSTAYYYVVTAENIYGETTPSLDVGATMASGQTATLCWANSANAGTVSHFNIYRGTSIDIAQMELLATVDGQTTSYPDTAGSPSSEAAAPTFQYFADGTQSNWYAALVQTSSTLDPVNGVSVNGLSYGFPYSDQGGVSTNVFFSTGSIPHDIYINLGTLSGPSFYTQSLADAVAGESYSQTLVVTGTGSNPSFAVTGGVLPSWLSLDQDTGVLSGTAPSTPPSQPYSFTIKATNSAGSVDWTYTLTVDQAAPAKAINVVGVTNNGIICTADQGSSFSSTFRITGGSGNYSLTTVSASAGIQNAAITANEDGSYTLSGDVSGTASTSTLANLTFTITDSTAGLSLSVTLYVTVNEVLSSFTSADPPNAVLNQPYYFVLTTDNSATDTISYAVTAGSLPTGLTLSSWGVISGTPTGPGSADGFVVTATDSSGNSISSPPLPTTPTPPATPPYKITVLSTSPGNPSFTPTPQAIIVLDNATAGDTYPVVLAATGGVGTISYLLASGTLPDGLTFNSDGTFSGTVTSGTSGTFLFTVKATDAIGDYVYQGFQVSVVGIAATPTMTLGDAATQLVIYGYGFGTTDTPLVTAVAVGGVAQTHFTVNSQTQLTVTLTGVTLTDGNAVNAAVTISSTPYTATVATVTSVAQPTITACYNQLDANATTLVINGTNYDADLVHGTNWVTLSSGTVVSVTTNAAAQLTVTISGVLDTGILHATVITDGVASETKAVGLVISSLSPVIYECANNLYNNVTSFVLEGSGFGASNQTTLTDPSGNVLYNGTVGLTDGQLILDLSNGSGGSILKNYTGLLDAQVVNLDNNYACSPTVSATVLPYSTQTPSSAVQIVTPSGTFSKVGTTLIVNGYGFTSNMTMTLKGYNTNDYQWDTFTVSTDYLWTYDSPNQVTITFQSAVNLANYSNIHLWAGNSAETEAACAGTAPTSPTMVAPGAANISSSSSTLTFTTQSGTFDATGTNVVVLYTEVEGVKTALSPTVIQATSSQEGVQNGSLDLTNTRLTVPLTGSLPLGNLYASVIVDGVVVANQIQIGTVVAGPTVTSSTTSCSTNPTMLTISGSGFNTSGLNTVTLYSGDTHQTQLPADTIVSVIAVSGTALTLVLNSSETLPTGALWANVTVYGESMATPVQIATVAPSYPAIDYCSTDLASTVGSAASSKTKSTSGTFAINGSNFTADTTVTLWTIAAEVGAVTVVDYTDTQLTCKVSSTMVLPVGQLYAIATNSNGTSNTVQVANVVSTLTPTISARTTNLANNATQLIIYGQNFDAGGGGVNTVELSSGTVQSVAVNGEGTELTVTLTGTLSAGPLQAKVITDGLHSGWTQVAYVTEAGAPTINTPTPIPTLLTTATSLTITGTGFDTSATGTNTVTLYSATNVQLGPIYAAHVVSDTELTITLNPATSELVAGAIYAVATVNGISSASAQVAAAVTQPTITASAAKWYLTNPITNAATLTINGVGFDPTDANNTVILPNGVSCTIKSASSTQIVIQLTSAPTAGALYAQVVVDGYTSAKTQIATVIPFVNTSTANLPITSGRLTITGLGFDTNTANDAITLSSGTATITAVTPTTMTIQIASGSGLKPGALTATVSIDGQTATAVVANVTATLPVISKNSVKTTTSSSPTTITWSVTDIYGGATPTLKIDGTTITSGIKSSGRGSTINYTYTGMVSAGSHVYTINATDSLGLSAATVGGSFSVTATTPVIKNVKATATTSANNVTIVWTVYNYDGVAGTALKIDGATIPSSSITSSGSGSTITYTYTGRNTAGKHSFTINATGPTGMAAKTVSGTFTVKATPPTISSVVATPGSSSTTTTITWSAAAIDGIKSCTLTIDGKAVSSSSIAVVITGTSAVGTTAANYTYTGVLAAGRHTYVIAVTSLANVSASTKSAAFTVTPTASTVSDPVVTINRKGQKVVTWTVTNDTDGVAKGTATVYIGATKVPVTKRVNKAGTIATYVYTDVKGLVSSGVAHSITATGSKSGSTTKEGTLTGL